MSSVPVPSFGDCDDKKSLNITPRLPVHRDAQTTFRAATRYFSKRFFRGEVFTMPGSTWFVTNTGTATRDKEMKCRAESGSSRAALVGRFAHRTTRDVLQDLNWIQALRAV